MTHYSRDHWGARPYEAHYLLDRDRVEGIALHWPAITKRLTDVEQVEAALRSWQQYHMDTRGWSDIAYQVAIDQAGNTYRLRGLRYRSAANGDENLNQRFGALLLVVAEGEKPSEKLVTTTRRIIGKHRALFPLSRRIVGHGQIRPEPTACPGPAIQRLINDGAFTPGREQA